MFSPKAADLAKYCWIAQTFLITLLTTVFVFTAFDFEWLRKRVPGGSCGAPLKLAFSRLQLLIALIVYWASVMLSPVLFGKVPLLISGTIISCKAIEAKNRTQ